MSRVQELEHRWSTDQVIAGIELGPWFNLLKQNGWHISPQYLHRVAMITGLAIPSTLLARIEDAIYARKLAEFEINPTPIILLGHWRTGTTHLHYLLQRDPNLTAPTLYQVIFPGSFLLTGKIGPKLLKGMLPDKRSYDNMALGWGVAAEDEIALAKMTGLSLYAGLSFPDAILRYERYVDFLETTPEERQKFKAALILLTKKIMLATGRRVVIKSCGHSARIRLLLECFPDAKFALIHRNPYETFASMLHFRGRVDWENFLQVPDESYLKTRWETTAELGLRVYERMIEDRKLIPAENYFEIPLAAFSGNEIPWLRRMYEQFHMPDWDRYEPLVRAYLDSIKGYEKNKLQIDPELRRFVYERWRLVFDTFGYAEETP